MKGKRSVAVGPGRAEGCARWWPVVTMSRLMVLLLAAAMLTSCGDEAPTGSTATAIAPDEASETGATADTAEHENDVAADDASNGTPAELTLGELVDRINARWAGLNAFREVGMSSVSPAPAPLASPIAASPTSERTQRTVREVILPDRVRYATEVDGRLEYELIVIGERVFGRGSVASLLDPAATPDEWIETDVATVARTALLGEAAAQQLTDLAAPRYSVPERLRPQPVRRLDPVSGNGTECDAYGAADTTSTGARIDITFAIEPDGHLCFIETEAIGITSRYTVSALDDSFTITAPTGARPLATPVATPATGATPVDFATPVATP